MKHEQIMVKKRGELFLGIAINRIKNKVIFNYSKAGLMKKKRIN